MPSMNLGPTKKAISFEPEKNTTAGDRSDSTAQEFAQQALDALKAGQAGKDQGKTWGWKIELGPGNDEIWHLTI